METFIERYSRGSCDELMDALACDPSDDTAYVMVMYEMLNDTRKMCKICPEAKELYGALLAAWMTMDGVMVMYEMLNDTRKMCPEAKKLYRVLEWAWSNMDSVQVDVNHYHQKIKAFCDQYAEKRLAAIERILDDPEGPLKKVRVDE